MACKGHKSCLACSFSTVFVFQGLRSSFSRSLFSGHPSHLAGSPCWWLLSFISVAELNQRFWTQDSDSVSRDFIFIFIAIYPFPNQLSFIQFQKLLVSLTKFCFTRRVISNCGRINKKTRWRRKFQLQDRCPRNFDTHPRDLALPGPKPQGSRPPGGQIPRNLALLACPSLGISPPPPTPTPLFEYLLDIYVYFGSRLGFEFRSFLLTLLKTSTQFRLSTNIQDRGSTCNFGKLYRRQQTRGVGVGLLEIFTDYLSSYAYSLKYYL